ncbi:MAG TPA: DUF4345 domain-containing protein [Phenylobacterium sp.]
MRILLIVLGASAVVIAAMDILMGPQATAGVFEGAYSAIAGGPRGGEPWPATMDNEMRFYAAMWGAYGLAAIWAARDLGRRLNLVPWLAGAFFAGGAGRALSLTSVGPPHPFFVLLMWIELTAPPLMILLWLLTRPARSREGGDPF